MTMAISHKGKTDTGKVRQHNEDAFYPVSYTHLARRPTSA